MAEPDVPDNLTVHRDIAYASLIGFRPLLLDIAIPATPEPAPLVLYLHGGGFAIGSHKSAHNPMAAQVTELLTGQGIAVACVQYRLSGEARFPGPLHDVKAALRWLKHRADQLHIDPDRTAAWGDSAGGYLTAMLAVTAGHPDLDGDPDGAPGQDTTIRAGVSWYGPANLATQPTLGPPILHLTDPADAPQARLLGAAVASVPELAAHASPISHVTPAAAPMLLVHGELDDGVPIGQSEELVAAYHAAPAPIRLIRVPNAGHGFPGVDSTPLFRASAAFLGQHLLDQATG